MRRVEDLLRQEPMTLDELAQRLPHSMSLTVRDSLLMHFCGKDESKKFRRDLAREAVTKSCMSTTTSLVTATGKVGSTLSTNTSKS